MQIKLTRDTITPELRRLMEEVKRPVTLYQAGAKAVQVGLTRHLKGLEARGNKMGWPSNYFFANGPTSVERNVGINKVNAAGAEIVIADARFVHRIMGGRVQAKRVKYLAIPMTAEAYAAAGKGSIKESFPGLKVVKGKNTSGAFLVRDMGNGVLEYMFRLVKSVVHDPKPEEMPDERVLAEGAREAMVKAARLLLRAKAS